MSAIKQKLDKLENHTGGANQSLIRQLWTSRPDKDIPEGKDYNKDGTPKNQNLDPIKGKQSLLHSLSVIHYNKFNEQGNANSDFFSTSSDYYNSNNTATGLRNPTGSAIVQEFGEGFVDHAMQYKESDFLFPEGYGKLPNNYMITLRRFSNPCGDNLKNNLENPSRDVSRLISY